MPCLNLADLFEQVVDNAGDREAVVATERRLTYAELDARANRLAHALASRGIGKGDFVGLQLTNGTEYLEGMLAAYKIRAVPVNVNYRYVEAELQYLFADAGLAGLVFHRAFADRVAAVLGEVQPMKTLFLVDDDSGTGSGSADIDGAEDYEEALASASPERDFPERSPDDLYVVYTGGTTGMPKGVLWRQEDIFFGAMGGGDPFQSGNFVKTAEELGERIVGSNGFTVLPGPPFMHASAHWVGFHTMFTGGRIVIPPGGRFDPPAVWQLVSNEKVNLIVVVGDAMARPLIDEFAANGETYDASSLIVIGSGGAIMSPATKEQIKEQLPWIMLADGFGSSETGTVGSAAGDGSKPQFRLNDQTKVIDAEGRPIEPGSGEVGQVARTGHIPLAYHGDPEKTASTFVEYDGRRWVLAGDMATVDEDGTILLLGRGSVSINTGGEKVFPEEVETALKAHPNVFDAVVVGVDDERWGQRVTAVVRLRDSSETLSLEDAQTHCRTLLAGYKVPREVVLVDEIVRSPAGKPDYRWAKAIARERAGGS